MQYEMQAQTSLKCRLKKDLEKYTPLLQIQTLHESKWLVGVFYFISKFPFLFACDVGGLGFELCVFVTGWRHARSSE